MKMKLISVVLVLMASTLLYCQEKLTIEEIIKYFPEGEYVSLKHIDIAAAEKSDGYYQYIKNRGGSRKSLSGLTAIPQNLAYAWTSFSNMNQARVKTLVDVEEIPKGGNACSSFTIDGKSYVAVDLGHKLCVIRFPPEFPLLKKINGNIHFEKTGEMVDGCNIYVYHHNLPSGSNKDYYAYPTPMNELLYSTELKIVREMIATGKGEQLAVDIETFFPGAMDVIPSLDCHWNFTKPDHLIRATLARAEKEGADNSALTMFKEQLAQLRPWCREYILSDPLKTKTMEIYDSNKDAQERLREKKELHEKQKMKPGRADLYKSIKLNTQGNIFISTTTWDTNYMEARKKSAERSKKEYQEFIKKQKLREENK